MEFVTAEAIVKCDHDGEVVNEPSQEWVTVETVPLLVHDDPENREINHCPNLVVPSIKPCEKTLTVESGYSTWVSIGAESVVLRSLRGLTDGTPPKTQHYTVRDPGQTFVGGDH